MSRSCGRCSARPTVAQPAINIDGGANGAFTAAARAAGIVSGTGTFDPYASDENFLLAAFIFEDVGVTAYKGAAPLIAQSLLIDAAAGILATEAYHAGLIRTVLYAKGIATPSLRTNANADQRCARQPRRDDRSRPGNRRWHDRQSRADRRERHHLQPHAGAGAQRRLSQSQRGRWRRVLPEWRQRQHQDQRGELTALSFVARRSYKTDIPRGAAPEQLRGG